MLDTVPDTQHGCRTALLAYAASRGLDEAAIQPILHKYVETRMVPSFLQARCEIDLLTKGRPMDDWNLRLLKKKMAEAQEALKTAQACIAFMEVQIDLMEKLAPPAPEQKVAEPAPKIEVVAEPPKPPEPEVPLIINEEWAQVLELLHNGTDHLFITGGAGTGKSTLLRHFIGGYRGTAAIVAPTGVAALRVGGETIHRMFSFGAHALEDDDIRQLSDSRRAKYRALDTLIIDEISMVRADLMDAIDLFMRKNGRDKEKPFGGCRLVMFGDLFQLPPVSKEKDEKRWLVNRYGLDMPYFFHAACWRDKPPIRKELTTIFRQKDEQFTAALNAIRAGTIQPEHLSLINTRFNPLFVPPPDSLWLTLTTTNASADNRNRSMLSALPGQPQVFEAYVTGDFDLKNAPTDEYLELKPGAAVMFVKNDSKRRWQNGTLGRVKSINPLQIEIDGISYEVETETWEQVRYQYDEKTQKLTKEVAGEFNQIPLKLAAAITIHKSQGLSLDHVILDLGYGTFAAGQAYVGLSRCRTLEGTVLRRPLREDDLITSSEVQKFLKGEPITRPTVKDNQLMLI